MREQQSVRPAALDRQSKQVARPMPCLRVEFDSDDAHIQ